MTWIVQKSDVDVEIEECYSQIDNLKNRIKLLKRMKLKEERIEDLAKEIKSSRKED